MQIPVCFAFLGGQGWEKGVQALVIWVILGWFWGGFGVKTCHKGVGFVLLAWYACFEVCHVVGCGFVTCLVCFGAVLGLFQGCCAPVIWVLLGWFWGQIMSKRGGVCFFGLVLMC
jgi:hypothetical protein